VEFYVLMQVLCILAIEHDAQIIIESARYLHINMVNDYHFKPFSEVNDTVFNK
jgi:hypothetical protein